MPGHTRIVTPVLPTEIGVERGLFVEEADYPHTRNACADCILGDKARYVRLIAQDDQPLCDSRTMGG
jgi:hypothetical protein